LSGFYRESHLHAHGQSRFYAVSSSTRSAGCGAAALLYSYDFRWSGAIMASYIGELPCIDRADRSMYGEPGWSPVKLSRRNPAQQRDKLFASSTCVLWMRSSLCFHSEAGSASILGR
ncbi:hypothetical protein L917_11589, partial [Phytophthora nicotianae]